MANRHRGEVDIELDGRRWSMALTLGALAELEDAYAAESLEALVTRFAEHKLGTQDLTRIIGAGLRGGGNEVSNAQLQAMTCPEGVVGMARAVKALLAVTFKDQGTTSEGSQSPP
ncbi:gene transfer agent family protein [Pseudovibrio exalbescens]|uniref:gene transfer agent family protein n=1 Tax=Pseudovibrio exalbescens TaxID=197461 RepID=UPI002366F187|nr:gene transfer agent family protein [Pseudovibrio exalbescens]MDD7909140.1 gene transfer agent family protein [Pseudovibrio exalbescens]